MCPTPSPPRLIYRQEAGRRPEVIIARANLSGFESNSYLPSILNLDALKSS